MIKRFEKGIFFFTLFSIILQTGKHFWPSFSYVDALRIDYLSPTLYLSDISISLLFVFFLLSWFNQRGKNLSFFSSPFFIGVLAVLFLSTVSAVNGLEALYGDIRALEILFFGYYTFIFFRSHDIKMAGYLFAVSSTVVSVLAMSQFFLQRSVGGLFYFLGERTFSASTIGIATFPLHGSTVLRPYATFPHPNVLAFFLLMSWVIVGEVAIHEKDTVRKSILWTSCFLTSAALILTFSRVTLVCFLLISTVFCFNYFKEKKMFRILFAAALFVIVLLVSPFLVGRFSDISLLYRDLFFRESLVSISFSIIQKNLFFGVGINNFFIHELSFQKTFSPIFLQPVHNIYLLVFSETGLFGFLLFILFLLKTFLKDKEPSVDEKDFQRSIFLLLVCTLFIGMFDHFLLTLQQGQLMFSFLLGLVWGIKVKTRRNY